MDQPSTGPRLMRGMAIGDQATFLASILESSTEYSIIAKDLDGLILAWNEGARRIYGYEAADVVGKASAFILHHADDVRSGRAQAILKESREVGKWEGELRRRRKNGTEFTAHVTITLRRDVAGQPIGFTMISRDLTESQRIDRELRESQEYNRGLIESNIDALITTDVLGVISDVNRQMCEMTGYGRGQLIGTAFNRYFTEPKRADEGIRRVLSEDRVTNYELTMRARDGKQTVVSYNATTFRSADKRLKGVFASARDITEQKALEEQLRRKNEELEEQYRRVQEANRLKSEFLANMSHELRTPLNGIIGFAQLMWDGKVGPVSADHKEYLGDILTSSRHLLQLINDVLDLSKVESGKMEFQPEPVDLASLVGEVRDILRTLASSKRMRVEVELDPGLDTIVVDPGKLKQVLYNYLSNALKFTRDEGRVTIRAVGEGARMFRLEVEDSGIGIRPEDVGRLFVEFQQLDASTAKKYPGTGLGLALTRRIVEAQGGHVGVRSEVGRGSTFFAVLPRIGRPSAEPERVASDGQATVTLPAGTPTILVVEDDSRDREWLNGTLTRAGYRVESVTTGAEAIARCEHRAFDAITLDLLLPDTTGWEVLRAIRAHGMNQTTPLVVVTVVGEHGPSVTFKVHDVLTKPVKDEVLLRSLERAELHPNESHAILFVDDDAKLLNLVSRTLPKLGYRTICVTDGEAGLRAITDELPAAIVLDLIMPGMDGVQFLHELGRIPRARRVPVIVWTVKDLSQAERAELRTMAQAIVPKGEGGTEALLRELREHLPTPPERAADAPGRAAS